MRKSLVEALSKDKDIQILGNAAREKRSLCL
jgi:hypothetical protein